MDEEVQPEHVQDDHSAKQLIERVAWAVIDASDVSHQPATDRGRGAVTNHHGARRALQQTERLSDSLQTRLTPERSSS
jgi:hypothetical protein